MLTWMLVGVVTFMLSLHELLSSCLISQMPELKIESGM